jgi:acyl-CoA synthetase (AMP-forming)/AMP-acid ligase II
MKVRDMTTAAGGEADRLPSDLKSLIRTQARARAEHTALIDARDGTQVTYGNLQVEVDRVGSLLDEAGLSQGSVLTLIGHNSLWLVLSLLGAMARGVIVKVLNPALTESELAQLLAHSGSTHVWTDQEFPRATLGAGVMIERYDCQSVGRGIAVSPGTSRAPGDALQEVDPAVGKRAAPSPLNGDARLEVTADMGALLIYTSGTTGRPKGVLLTHGNLVQNARAAAHRLKLANDHVTLTLLPLFHTFALVSDLLTMLSVGGTATIFRGFDVARLDELSVALARFDVRSFSVVPLVADLMLRFGVRLPTSVRYAVAGAAPLRPATAKAFRAEYGVPIIPAYGMTETTCFCTISPPEALVEGSCGVPAECSVRCVDEAGQDVARGQVGELVVCGQNVMRGGYFKDTRSAYLDESRQWLLTGDLARIDADGYVFIVGRKKNMIIRGGEKVYLEDVDQGLRSLHGIVDCASVGLPGGERAMVERFASFIVVDPSASVSAEQVLEHLRAVLGAAKCPDRVILTSQIPRTATGKVRMQQLREAAGVVS